MAKSVSSQLAKEFREVSDHLKAPVSNLVVNTIERSFDVAETAISHVGELVGAVIDEAARVCDRVARGLDTDKD